MRTLTSLTVIILLLISAAGYSQNPAQQSSSTLLKNQQDSISYAYGMTIAKSLKDINLVLNYDLVTKGLKDFSTPSRKLDDEQLATLMDMLQQIVFTNEQNRIEKLAQKNQEEELAFFATNQKKANIVTTGSGLQYEIIAKGPQSSASPTLNDSVVFNYEGRFLDGTKFESTYESGYPATLSMKDLILGWQEGLQLIKAGDTIMLYLPSKLAFGIKGSSKIEPNKGLIFRIDLIKVIAGKS